MTVSYAVSPASCGFLSLLFRWRGSVWKLVYLELFFFYFIYTTIAIFYRFIFNDFLKRIFERIVFLCSTFMDLIPLSFVLGFYLLFIATRWWNKYTAIPWPDKLMNSIALYIPGSDETSRVLRRTMMRYLNVALVLVLRSISVTVKRRFPTRDHLVDAGFLTKPELERLNSVPSADFNTFWIPCTWFINLLREAKQECRITDSNGIKLIMEEFNEFRSQCGLLWSYDWISFPLAYTQVVTLATYAFFAACLFARQYVDIPKNVKLHHSNLIFQLSSPIYNIFQLFFYLALLKIAEQLNNPFGDDDDDFELNWIIDRHIKVSYLGVDGLNTQPPPLLRDSYFYQQDMKLPYTEASQGYKKKTYRGSVARMQIPSKLQNLLVPELAEEDDDDEIAPRLGNREASLWTLGSGKINRKSSVPNQNLDTMKLEGGSNNWNACNSSLNSPVDGLTSEDKQVPDNTVRASQHLEVPEESGAEPDETQNVIPQTQCSRLRRASQVPKRAFKVVKKESKKTPQKRGHDTHPQNHWVAFLSSAIPDKDNEVLSLFHSDKPQVFEYPLDGTRRQSLDVRRSQSFPERSSSRFQRMPGDKEYVVADEENREILTEADLPEDKDNLSTVNLQIVYEGTEDDEGPDGIVTEPPPHVSFTKSNESKE